MQNNVLEYFEKTVSRYKNKIAVIDKNLELTFEELERFSKRLSYIITQNIDEIKKPIPVYLPKGADCLVAFLAILYSGNFYVPIDIRSPKIRTKSIFQDLGNSLVIASNEYFDVLLSIGLDSKNIILVDDAYNEDFKYDEQVIIDRSDSLIDLDPIYTIYTSGSTGQPKGVVISHRSVIDYIDWARACFNISHEEIIGNQSPFYFDNSTLDIYLCFATGATLVIIPEQYFTFPIKLIEYIVSKEINFIFWVPSVLINIANMKLLDNVDIDCLEKVLFAGEVMYNKHLNYWRKKLPNRLFANLYGPTEITVDCTYYIVKKKFNDDDKLPIGTPCRNTDVFILIDENRLAEKNEIGELCVRGSSLALGYWNKFDETNRVFTQNPMNKNYIDRIYRTGDLVYLNEEDEIIFVGRKDTQIKHMGYRIELGEIENACLTLGEISNVCVIYNENKKEIILFYEGDKVLSNATIRKRLLNLIPKYMLPKKVYKLERFPLNRNGKINRIELADNYCDIG